MTELEKIAQDFDVALGLRDAGRYHDEIPVLLKVAERLSRVEKSAAVGGTRADRLLAHTWIQLSYAYKNTGNETARLSSSQTAVELAPNNDLASMGLFFALQDAGRLAEAYDEIVRLLRIRSSKLYAELLSGLGDTSRSKYSETIDVARELQREHELKRR